MRGAVPDDGSCTSVNSACAQGLNAADPTNILACVNNGCRYWATSWDPTAAYSTNGSTVRGSLDPSHYQDFANYLSNYIASLRQYYGVTLYAISPQNEPDVCADYASSLWSGSVIDDFVKNYLGPTMKSRGQWPETMIIIPDASQDTSNSLPSLAGPCMNDSACSVYVGVNDVHNYDNESVQNLYNVSHFWEGEIAGFTWNSINGPGCTNGAWCNTIRDAMTWADIYDREIAQSNMTGWNYWNFAQGDQNDNGALIEGGIVSTRAYILAEYAKYIRPGFAHIGATHAAQNGVTVSAYKSASGSFSIVATNQNSSDVNQTFTFNDVSPSSVTPTITSASQQLQDLSSVSVSGGSFTYTLPAQSVITFHWQ